MLRPATPLAVILFVAFALQLLATLSAPIITAIPLATNAGTTFGVFGTCRGTACSPIGIGYDASPDNSANDFSFKSVSTRRTLSSILILHAVAALFSLVCTALAIAAHFHAPSHSARFLLGLVILTFPTLLISLFAFVIDLVLFLPHAAWGTWIMLAASILVFVSGVLTCAMRRTLRSRKERTKRIEENAEMSGENFYNRQRAASPPPLTQQPTAPMVNGAPGADNLPGFAVYDAKSRTSNDDDRTPLNAANSTTGTGISSVSGGRDPASEDGMERYARGGSSLRGRGRGNYNGPRDEFVNPIPAGFGPDRSQEYIGRPSGESQRSMRSRGGGYWPRGGYGRGGPMRGRGGPPRGRGGPIRGGPMRGGPMGGRGGPVGMAYGGPGQAPGPGPEYGQAYGEPDYGPPRGQDHDQSYGVATAYGPGPYGGRDPSPGPPSNPGGYGRRDPSPGPPSNPGGYGRRPSPGLPSNPGYGRRPSPGLPSNPGYDRQQSPGPPSNYSGMRDPSPGPAYAQPYGAAYSSRRSSLARAESPPPLPGQAPPLPDPSTIGQAVEMDHLTGSPANTPGFIPPPHPFRDSDSDVQGLVGMQQARNNEPMSPTSLYSSQRTESYAPTQPSQSISARRPTPPLQAIAGSPAMIEARQSPQIQQASAYMQPSKARVSGDNYYEDVDPRFEEQPPPALTPEPQRQVLETSPSYDSIANGPASDSSHFTSISERGVNPNWRPEGGPYGPGGVPNRGPPQQAPPQQQRDFILAGNPDFEVPGAAGRGAPRMRGGPGMI